MNAKKLPTKRDTRVATPPEASPIPPPAQPKSEGKVSIEWQGPLPPPGALKQFDEIIPNGADRILGMVEREQAARLKIEDRASLVEAAIAIGGRVVGALLLMMCIAAALWLAYMGYDWKVILALLSVPLLTLIGKFFTGSSK